jgi:hypothetical protein
MWTGVLLLSLVATAPSAGQPPASTASGPCATWQDCRAAVEASLATESFDIALDAAWRALQLGPRDDPALMFLLARAQARAGRPQDALVMVRRLADRGIATEAATHPDLERMRNLEGWADLQILVARVAAGEPPLPGPAATRGAPAAATTGPALAAGAIDPATGGAAAPSAAAIAVTMGTPEVTEEALRFRTDPFVPAGLAYDAVSRRFVIGDRLGRKLRIVGEGLDHAVDLVRAESAGFLDIRSLAIDTRRGDLWVVTGDEAGTAGMLHRIQLVSGRPLQSLPLAADGRSFQPIDLAVSEAGAVFVLDRDGRILRATPNSSTLAVVVDRPSRAAASSVSLSRGGGVAYVSHATGVARVDLVKRTVSDVATTAELALTGIERLRAHRDGFVAVQRGPDGDVRLLRLAFAPGGRRVRTATTYPVRIDAGESLTAFAVLGDEVSFVTGGTEDPGEARASSSAIGPPAEFVVRRFRLR